jgi:hypothetical protein
VGWGIVLFRNVRCVRANHPYFVLARCRLALALVRLAANVRRAPPADGRTLGTSRGVGVFWCS